MDDFGFWVWVLASAVWFLVCLAVSTFVVVTVLQWMGVV